MSKKKLKTNYRGHKPQRIQGHYHNGVHRYTTPSGDLYVKDGEIVRNEEISEASEVIETVISIPAEENPVTVDEPALTPEKEAEGTVAEEAAVNSEEMEDNPELEDNTEEADTPEVSKSSEETPAETEETVAETPEQAEPSGDTEAEVTETEEAAVISEEMEDNPELAENTEENGSQEVSESGEETPSETEEPAAETPEQAELSEDTETEVTETEENSGTSEEIENNPELKESTEEADTPEAVKSIEEAEAEITETPEQAETSSETKTGEAKAEKTKRTLPFFLVMTLILVYFEMILHQAGGFAFTAWSVGAAVLFSAFWAGLITWLTKLITNEKARRIVRTAVIALIALLFLICYFVHKQFKVFYDITTITAGAGGVLGQFQGNIMEMLMSFDGVSKIIMYFLPAVLYAVFASKVEKAADITKKKLITIAASAAMLVCSVGTVYVSPAWKTFTSEYNFQNAVGSFGLLTAFALDAKKILLPDMTFGFEPVLTKLIHTTKEGNQQMLVWNKNEMDFDWDALAETADRTQASLDAYVASQTASRKNDYTGLFEGKNLIMLTAEAFTAEVIDPELTPTLYRLATKGINFTDFYQPSSAGTTGGEYSVLFGGLPMIGGSSVKNTADYNNYMTIASQLDRLGYEGWAFHNNTYTFYDRHKTHVNLGYSNGFMAYGNGMEEYVRWRWPQSDLEMIEGTMPIYENEEHFDVYYMTVSGHNGYTYNSNAMSQKNWDRVKDLDYSEPVKAYIACNLELEDALTYMVNRLEELGIADDTVIVLCTDHFPYGLDYDGGLGNMPYLSELYGYNVDNYLDRDHNRLIIWSGCLEDEEPIVVDTPVSSLDILPTLSNLFGTEFDSRLFAGRDVFSDAEPLVFTVYYDWKTTLGTYNSLTGEFTPNEGVTVPEGYEERIKKLVRNKIQYCTGLCNTDYFGHLFGNKE